MVKAFFLIALFALLPPAFGCTRGSAHEATTFRLSLRGPWFSEDTTRAVPRIDRCASEHWTRKDDLRRLMPPADQDFYIWYCTTYDIPAERAQLPGNYALNLGVIGDLDVAYVDGIEVGSYSNVAGITPVGIHHYRSYPLWPRTLTPGVHTLEIRVLQTDGLSGAINDQHVLAILPARESQLNSWWHDFFRTDLPFALGMAILVVGLYYGILALIERREKRFFYFAALCLCVFGGISAFSYYFTLLIGDSALEVKIGAISGFWLIHFVVAFIRESERREKNRWDRVSLAVAILCTVPEIFAPNVQIASLISFVWVPWFFTLLIYTGLALVRAWRRVRTREMGWIVCAFALFALASTSDFVVSLFLPSAYLMTPYGYVLFTVSLNILLAREHGDALVDRRKKVVLEAQVEHLRTLTDIDTLTQLYNRRTFFEHFEHHFQLAKSGGANFALLVLDIDHFKRFNDAHGHPEGDKLLRRFSEVLTKSVRPTDVVGRLGGEEFAILLNGVQDGMAQMLAERVRYAVEMCVDMRAHRDGSHVTVSIGIAEPREDTPNIETLYEQADAALYVAKRVRNSTMRFSLIPTVQDLKHISILPSRSETPRSDTRGKA